MNGYELLTSNYVALIRQDTGEVIEIDTTKSVDLNYNWAVTSHPVERGVEISDHTQRLPAEMQLVGVLTGLDIERAGTYGTYGKMKYEAFRDWMIGASTTLWTVVVPKRPSMVDCLITTFRYTMTMDDFIEVTIGVREVRLVDSFTTAPIYSVSTGSGGGVGRNPSASSRAELSPEAQDGVQEPRASTAWNVKESLKSLASALSPF
jgi:hypothetical protein